MLVFKPIPFDTKNKNVLPKDKQMKTYLNRALGCLLLVVVASGCKKILTIDQGGSINKTTPVSVDDFEKLLNNIAMYDLGGGLSLSNAAATFILFDAISDDMHRSKDLLPPQYGGILTGVRPIDNFYLWTAKPWDDSSVDELYKDSYQWISQMNVLIDNMPTARPAGQEARRAVAIARAKINRAYFYLLLVNAYGPVYQSGSAQNDLGVPLVLHPTLASKNRASVAEVYQQILTDLQDALRTPELPDLAQPDIVSPGKGEAWALLARTQLYRGDFKAAQEAANAALKINSKLLDYRTFLPIAGSPLFQIVDSRPLTLIDQKTNPEIYTARVLPIEINKTMPWEQILLSPELAQLFETGDQRLLNTVSIKATNGPSYRWFFQKGLGGLVYLQMAVTVPEMMLTKAECLARNGDAAGAIALLNALRIYRFKPADYKELPATVNAETALRQVLDERRRELMFRGLRLFDLKRLNLDPRFKKDLVRLDDGGKEMARLTAGSPRYVLPFSPQTLAANPLLVQNPR